MAERLTDAELATIRAEHAPVDSGLDDGRLICNSNSCWTNGLVEEFYATFWPCDAARLLAHFAPGPVPHLAGLDADPDVWIGHGFIGPNGNKPERDSPMPPGWTKVEPGVYEQTFRESDAALELDTPHCHCGAQGMEMSHPRHAPTAEQQVAIDGGLFGPADQNELPTVPAIYPSGNRQWSD